MLKHVRTWWEVARRAAPALPAAPACDSGDAFRRAGPGRHPDGLLRLPPSALAGRDPLRHGRDRQNRHSPGPGRRRTGQVRLPGRHRLDRRQPESGGRGGAAMPGVGPGARARRTPDRVLAALGRCGRAPFTADHRRRGLGRWAAAAHRWPWAAGGDPDHDATRRGDQGRGRALVVGRRGHGGGYTRTGTYRGQGVGRSGRRAPADR